MKLHFKNSIIFFLLSLCLLTGITASACKKKAAGPKEKLTLGVLAQTLAAAPVYIAIEKGFFAAEGLEVEVKEYPSGPLALKDMLDQKSELITISEFPLALKILDNPDLAVLATFSVGYDNMKVMARRDKGIKTIADLKGKKIGYTFGTASHLFLDFFLTYNQIDNKEVTMTDMLPPALPLALKVGKVDAIAVWEPHGYEARRLLGDKIIHLRAPEIYRTTTNLAARRSWLKQNPRAAIKAVRGVDKAIAFIKEHKKEAQAVVGRKLDLDSSALEPLWDEFTYELSIDRYLTLAMEAEARWAIKNKLTDKKKVPNYLDHFYTEGLEAVKPGAVTIIR